MTALSRRHVLAGAAATVAAAALPAVAVADGIGPNAGMMADAAARHPDSYVVLTGTGSFSDGAPDVGAWLWDFETREVYERVESGWQFLFSLNDPRKE